MDIVCNENVFCAVELTGVDNAGKPWTMYQFTPAPGYALWRDNETGNIDPETGEPNCYWYAISCDGKDVEEYAAHIWARLIDDTMEVAGGEVDADCL